MKLKLPGILLFVFLASACFRLSADAIASDSTVVQLRKFDAGALKQYKSQSDFRYETERPEGLNLLGWIEYLLGKLFNKLFSTGQQSGIIKFILYALMLFAALMIILNILGINVRSVITSGSSQVINHQLAEENVHEMDMDQLIAEAYNNKQWRLGIRYQYLKALRLLTDKELIQWQAGKTNMDYYYELEAKNLKDVFLDITGDFENAWYGNHELSLGDYTQTSAGFEKFYGAVKNYREQA